LKILAVWLALFMVMSICVLAYSSTRTRSANLCEKDGAGKCLKGIKTYFTTIAGGRLPVYYKTGYIRFREQSDKFKLDLSTSYLNQTKEYQVAIEGPGGTPTDTLLAGACQSPNQLVPCGTNGLCWECGWWGNKGFYNFYIGKLGSLRKTLVTLDDHYNINLSTGEYKDVLFLIKDNGPPWGHPLEASTRISFRII